MYFSLYKKFLTKNSNSKIILAIFVTVAEGPTLEARKMKNRRSFTFATGINRAISDRISLKNNLQEILARKRIGLFHSHDLLKNCDSLKAFYYPNGLGFLKYSYLCSYLFPSKLRFLLIKQKN